MKKKITKPRPTLSKKKRPHASLDHCEEMEHKDWVDDLNLHKRLQNPSVEVAKLLSKKTK